MKNLLKISVLAFSLSLINFAIAKPVYSIDEKMYAQMHNVSLSEARLATIFGQHKETVMHRLQTSYRGRISGTYIESFPTYKIVLRLTGTGRDATKYFAIKNHKGLYLPVEFQYGAKITKEQARERMPSAQALATRYFDTVQTVFYDEKTGEMNIEIKEKPTPEVLAKIEQLKQAWGYTDLPLNIKLVNYTITPL